MENQNVRKLLIDERFKVAVEEYKSFNDFVAVSMLNEVLETNVSFKRTVKKYRLLLRKYMTTFDARFIEVFKEYKALYTENYDNVFFLGIRPESIHFEFKFKAED